MVQQLISTKDTYRKSSRKKYIVLYQYLPLTPPSITDISLDMSFSLPLTVIPIHQLNSIIRGPVTRHISDLMRDLLMDTIAARERGTVVAERRTGAAEYGGKDTAEGGQEGGHAAAHN